MDWREELHWEFDHAQKARLGGNEGRARVCARRAAGIAIREYLARTGQPAQTVSAIELLDLLQARTDLSPDLRQAAAALRMRVTQAFDLPAHADLIAEAMKLCRGLLPDWDE
jgi:HEPN domain-containing protein